MATARLLVVGLLLTSSGGCPSRGANRPDETMPGKPGEAKAVDLEPLGAHADQAPPPNRALRPSAARAAHYAAQRRMLRKGPYLMDLPPAPANGQLRDGDIPGYFVPIQSPKGTRALKRWNAALTALEAGNNEDGKVRILMYGASGTAADINTGYVRTYLHARFGDGGIGYVPLGRQWKWYRHNEVTVSSSKHWKKEHGQVRDRRDGYLGLLGMSFSSSSEKAFVRIEPKKSSASAQEIALIDLYFLAQPGGGSFVVELGGEPKATVSTQADAPRAGYHTMEVEPGRYAIEVSPVGDGEVRLFGAVLERKNPGVVLDVLGIGGTRSSNHIVWDEALWTEHIRRRDPDLYSLSYGANASVDEDEPIEKYRENLVTVLERFARAVPEASCVLFSPVDFPKKTEEGLLPRPRLAQIIEIQRELAAEYGCGFWDGVAFMGGVGSMARWVGADPPMARDDHLHFTKYGGVRKGMALSDALMLEYDWAQEQSK